MMSCFFSALTLDFFPPVSAFNRRKSNLRRGVVRSLTLSHASTRAARVNVHFHFQPRGVVSGDDGGGSDANNSRGGGSCGAVGGGGGGGGRD